MTRDPFIKLFSRQTFRYDTQLFALLDSSATTVSHSCGVDGARGNHPCKHYENTYRHRLQHQYRENLGDPYWDELAEAIAELCAALAETPEDPCCLWSIRGDGQYDFAVFENSRTGSIVGCLRLLKSMQRPKGAR